MLFLPFRQFGVVALHVIGYLLLRKALTARRANLSRLIKIRLCSFFVPPRIFQTIYGIFFCLRF